MPIIFQAFHQATKSPVVLQASLTKKICHQSVLVHTFSTECHFQSSELWFCRNNSCTFWVQTSQMNPGKFATYQFDRFLCDLGKVAFGLEHSSLKCQGTVFPLVKIWWNLTVIGLTTSWLVHWRCVCCSTVCGWLDGTFKYIVLCPVITGKNLLITGVVGKAFSGQSWHFCQSDYWFEFFFCSNVQGWALAKQRA